ncbi:methyltransferase domain-containing protein [Nostoc sp. C117]|uniref:methyltransferase domain-containing protein n=1 Tax=Nostoc sp. C117 TaxID=3349875 RepID=UPI00370DCDF6
MNVIDDWYLENLVCPRDKSKLHLSGNFLISETGITYPIIQGIPIMLLDNVEQTIELANQSLAAQQNYQDIYFIETLGISQEQKKYLNEYIGNKNIEDFSIDPIVQFLVGATNGILYTDAIGNLPKYPIPELRLPNGSGKNLLDIGCSWGRWCIAGANKNYNCVGIDPSLGAVLAGKRIAKKLGLNIHFIVGDARHLPFKSYDFDQVFSYSVIQHFSKLNARKALKEVDRVLKPNGSSLIQMPNRIGIRSLQHQISRGFEEGDNFDVRYWGVGELLKCFNQEIGKSKLTIDGFFGLGIQKADVDLLPLKYKLIVELSEALKTVSIIIPFLKYFADSVYIESMKTS